MVLTIAVMRIEQLEGTQVQQKGGGLSEAVLAFLATMIEADKVVLMMFSTWKYSM